MLLAREYVLSFYLFFVFQLRNDLVEIFSEVVDHLSLSNPSEGRNPFQSLYHNWYDLVVLVNYEDVKQFDQP